MVAATLLIYGSVVLSAIFWLLNLWLAVKTKTFEKRRPLFLLIIAGIIGVTIIYLAAPLDELWHRIYGIDVVIWSLPHVMLIVGGILGGLATAGVARYHITYERRKFFLEKIVIPLFLGSVLAGLMLVLAEGEFEKTLPLDHPVQNRPLWVYPSWLVIFSFTMFMVSKHVSELKLSAVFTLCSYVVLRMFPVVFNYLYGMPSVPAFPQFVPLLLGMALIVDIVWQKTKN